MSAVAPYSDIYFCNVPFDSSYNNVCDAANSTNIAALAVYVSSNYSYQRRDSVIRVGCAIDDLVIPGANYVMYRNKAHENKWFYAFIDKLEYEAEAVTLVTIRTDIYQTWRSQATILPCFTVREHVTDDTIGTHVFPEGLETGEMINAGFTRVGLRTFRIVVATTKSWNGSAIGSNIGGGIYHGIYAGCYYYSFASTNIADIGTMISTFVNNSAKDAIMGIFLMPQMILEDRLGKLDDTYACPSLTHTCPARPTTLDGYTPKNNKCLTFPYTYLYGHNNNGGAAMFKFEEFLDTPSMQVVGSLGPNPSVKVYPRNKRHNSGTGESTNMDEALTISGWPMCMYATSAWDNYNATQGAAGMAGMAGSIMATVVGLSSANPVIAVGGVIGAFQSVSQMYQKSVQPPQASGAVAAAPVNLGFSMQDIHFYARTIRREYAEIVDEFFTHYGYKVNRLKIPNVTGRTNWNFVQTIDAAIKGPIPDTDRREFEAILNHGVTIWHTMPNYGNYSLTNGVAT